VAREVSSADVRGGPRANLRRSVRADHCRERRALHGNHQGMDFNGNDFIYNGQMTVTQASWGSSGSSPMVGIHVVASQSAQGMWWDLYLAALDSR
jgi:hypothetical protein